MEEDVQEPNLEERQEEEQGKGSEEGKEDASGAPPVGGPTLEELEYLSDVPLPVKVQLGEAELRIRDLLTLQTNSVIELEKLAGEPLDFFLNHNMVAKGEVVVVNEKYGIRLTDIIRQDEGKGNG